MSRAHIKSWDAAMSDLSAEARMLTTALEVFATARDKEHEDALQSGKGGAHSEKRQSSASAVPLPPLRRGDAMIDPLPVSKEKQAVLSRTRPSWLPPKSQKEERRHLREYARMMASAREAERRRDDRLRRDTLRRDRDQARLGDLWERQVLARWSRAVTDPATRDLWWRGVSARARGEVWRRAVGNELGLTERSYEAALERAREAERALLALDEGARSEQREWQALEALRRDARGAHPDLKIFAAGDGPLHGAFEDLLMAYAAYRADGGYVEGSHVSAFARPTQRPHHIANVG